MRWQLPWLIVALLLLLLLGLISLGWWRSSGVGPQVQVPMFYDAHYLYPRAWTQEQAAPGTPAPAPLAFFGQNRISQKFISGSDQLSMIEIWLAGQMNEQVAVSLSDDQGESANGEIVLVDGLDGANYQLAFEPFEQARGREFILTLIAPQATIDNPVVTRTVGGDRLGGSLALNEYNRPGNLSILTYASGLPGAWWLQAVGEQILPAVFRLRLQQYKPPAFKGQIFTLLLLSTGSLSLLFLALASQRKIMSWRAVSKALGWILVLALTLFLLWQVLDGRVIAFSRSFALEKADSIIAQAPSPDAPRRLMNDLTAVLWTAERLPEERFVESDLVANLPAIRVPSDSSLKYSIDVPPGARFRTGIVARGEGEFHAVVNIGTESVHVEDITAGPTLDQEDISWIEIDLAPWSGQPITLILSTEGESGSLEGWWIMPQIETESEWLLADSPPKAPDIEMVRYRFDDVIELQGYKIKPDSLKSGEPLEVTLYWWLLEETHSYAKVFVHLLDEQGQLMAQDDAQPVKDTYPLPLWQQGAVVVDEHLLQVPADLAEGTYSLAVGLYDPDSLRRWNVAGEDGQIYPDGRVLLTENIEVAP